MKQTCFKKGIITLVFFLTFAFCALFATAVTAHANAANPKLNVKSKAIVKGKDYALKVYNLSETQTVSFTSESPKIASVDEAGVVTGLSVGTTVITAIIEDSVSDEPLRLQCKITVGPPAFLIKLSRQQADMVIGERSMMSWMIAPLNTVELPKFSSSNPDVASVSAGGVVTAKSAGTAYIFAQIDNGQYSACCITVTEELTVAENAEEPVVAEATAESTESNERTFADFLIDLNANFTNGDNTSESTGADSAQ